MRPAQRGGENTVVDARQAARYLARLDREAYDLLTQISVSFHRRQKAFESVIHSPILSTSDTGEFLIRYSYFTMDPFQVPFDRMEPWYRAYKRFAALVRDPRHQYQFRLGGGDFVLYDNHRMLHARSGFSGPRWLRGVYFDESEDRQDAILSSPPRSLSIIARS
jgi:gamma-butyrobetaine dioxygenase/trimethyllysine dioxygenase